MSARRRARVVARRPRGRRGAVLVLVAMLMVPLVALAALSIDVGWWQVGANQLQTSADAAALAGARALQLDTTGSPHARVTAYARQVAASNRAFAETVSVNGGDVEGRYWDPVALSIAPVDWGNPVTNAVQVTTRSTPGLILAGATGQTAPTIARRATAWIANINQLECITPWTLSYAALYDRIAALTPGVPNPTPPPSPGQRPHLTQQQVAALTIGDFGERLRTVVLRGPNTPAALPATASGITAYDGAWTAHGFAGAGSAGAFHANVQGCDRTVVSVTGDEGATLPVNDYECWAVRALSGSTSTTCPTGWIDEAPSRSVTCHYRPLSGTTHDAGCYERASSPTPGVRRRVVWSDPTAGGADHRVVGTANIACAFRGLADPAAGIVETCTPPGGAPIANLPRGTLAVTFHGLTTILRLGEESTDFGNVVSLDQRLLLVR
jgi:Flp pilus assembly protein TadG